MSGGSSNFFQYIVTFNQLAEGRVLPIQEAWVAMADKKLAAGRIRVLGAGHREHATNVGAVTEFGFDLVTGVACAPGGFLGGILGFGVAALDHEILDHPVETRAI